MKLTIDLCSGLGGLSQAFKDEGWEVVTVDDNPKFNPTICADIRKVTSQDIAGATRLQNFPEYEIVVIVASPPCQRFSIANPLWPKKGIGEAMEIVGACLELIAEIKPKFWLLENPRGRLRWFLGKPYSSFNLKGLGYRTCKPTDLWGNVPFGLIPDGGKNNDFRGRKYPAPKGSYFGQVRSPALRAKMPYGLSKAVLEAVDGGG